MHKKIIYAKILIKRSPERRLFDDFFSILEWLHLKKKILIRFRTAPSGDQYKKYKSSIEYFDFQNSATIPVPNKQNSATIPVPINKTLKIQKLIICSTSIERCFFFSIIFGSACIQIFFFFTQGALNTEGMDLHYCSPIHTA